MGRYIDAREAGRILGTTRNNVNMLAKAGKLAVAGHEPCRGRGGRRAMFDEAAVRRLADAGYGGETKQPGGRPKKPGNTAGHCLPRAGMTPDDPEPKCPIEGLCGCRRRCSPRRTTGRSSGGGRRRREPRAGRGGGGGAGTAPPPRW